MNSEIKFRSKELGTGQWVYGSLLQDDYGTFKIVSFIDHHETWHDVDPDTIGQFTGLYDCNDTKIYEGDILDCPPEKTIMLEVRYNPKQGAFCLAEHTHTEGVILGTTPLGEMLRHYRDMHIIGNIHDNPELIKGE